MNNIWGFKNVTVSEKFTRGTIAPISKEGGLTYWAAESFHRAECRSVVAVGAYVSVARTRALNRMCANAQEITAWQLEWIRRKHDCSGEGFKDPLRAYMTC